jgi:hypothetical protein
MSEFGGVTPTTAYTGENNSKFSKFHFSAEKVSYKQFMTSILNMNHSNDVNDYHASSKSAPSPPTFNFVRRMENKRGSCKVILGGVVVIVKLW